MRLKGAEIGLALLIPFLTGCVPMETIWAKLFVGVLGVVVAGIASILSLYKYHENWIEYRGATEALNYEKFLYLTGSGYYMENNTLRAFVERVEGILSKENSRWSQNNVTQKKEGHPECKYNSGKAPH